MNGQSAAPHRRPLSRVWMITFADLLSLLLAFFVLLFAMSKLEIDVWKALVAAISERTSPLQHWTQPLQKTERMAPRLSSRRTFDLDYLTGLLRNKMADSQVLALGTLQRLDDGLVLSLPAERLFPAGQAELRPEGAGAVAALAAALKGVGNAVELVGHTDRSPPPPDASYTSNWDLTLARALALSNALQAAGYDRDLKVLGVADAGFGAISAKLPEAERRRLSRRVDLVIRETSAQGGSIVP